MIKFTEIAENEIKTVAETLFDGSSLAEEIMSSFDFDDDISYAVAHFDGCLIVRVFDFGRYLFLYPFELDEDAKIDGAVLKMAEYAMREELDFVLSGVPTEGVNLLLELGFSHLEIDREDEDSYRVWAKNECVLLDEIPKFNYGEIKVSALDSSLEKEYAELCRDEELNRFWGYDYREDAPTQDDSFFLNQANSGFARGASITLALKKDEAFIGSVELFAFDGRGGCEFAIKIARDYQSRGYGTLGTKAAIKAAERIGISRISCDVMKQNTRSVSMMQKIFGAPVSTCDNILRFTKTIN